MSAGLVRYRLCDRDFDCDRCPLDAALRGDAGWPSADQPQAAEAGRALSFPNDRRYSPGHCWLQAREKSLARVGIDALAAALLGVPAALRRLHGGPAVAAGDAVVALDLAHGSLPLAAPTAGGALRLNDAAEHSPQLVVEDPYGEGWLFELRGRGPQLPTLVDAAAALDQSRLDLRHFGRRAALGLLAGADGVGATLADGGEPLTDLRRMLGPQRYLALIRELVH
jgi:glycine cleavage system H protein